MSTPALLVLLHLSAAPVPLPDALARSSAAQDPARTEGAASPTVVHALDEALPVERARTIFAPGGRGFALILPAGDDARLAEIAPDLPDAGEGADVVQRSSSSRSSGGGALGRGGGGTQPSRLWHDDRVTEAWDFLDGVGFSEDGAHLAYRRGRLLEDGRQEWQVVHDGSPGLPYAWVGRPSLSPDGEAVAYWAGEDVRHDPPGGISIGQATTPSGRHGGAYFVVEDDDEGDRCPPTPEKYPPVWRADGKRLAHLFLDEDGLQVMVGKRAHGPYQDATGPVWAPDGNACGWVGVPKSGRGAVFVGKRDYDEGAEALGPPAFAGKGRSFAWPAKRDGQLVVVHDGEVLGLPFGRLGKIALDPDGDHVAFVASNSQSSQSVSVSGQTVVLDDLQLVGDEESGDDRVTWSLVVDGAVVSGGWNFIGRPHFSEDGAWLAAPVRRGEDWHLLTVRVDDDGQHSVGQTARYDAVGPARFDDDGIHFGARAERELLRLVLPIRGRD